MTNTTRVTVAVPLHASAPWIDNVVANVRSLPDAVTEVLLSDRTSMDDAADVLRERLADDPRVVVVREARRLGWPEHCQLLIEEASGDLVMLMPHDDVFDPSWVPVLARALDDHPRALLAYGRVVMVAADGVTPDHAWQPRRPPPGEISGMTAVDLIADGELGPPFRGLLRRRAVLDHGIRLLPPAAYPGRHHGVDQLWGLAIAVRGALVYDERTVTYKRVHPASATATARPGRPGSLQLGALAVVRRHGPGGLVGVRMAARLGRSGVGEMVHWATEAARRIVRPIVTRCLRRCLKRCLKR